ncbi:hypothetical protein [Mycobacterium sp.]|nr:hypothetical protein [Mycobacterium sp.]
MPARPIRLGLTLPGRNSVPEMAEEAPRHCWHATSPPWTPQPVGG